LVDEPQSAGDASRKESPQADCGADLWANHQGGPTQTRKDNQQNAVRFHDVFV
jgi:hypothetical protein